MQCVTVSKQKLVFKRQTLGFESNRVVLEIQRQTCSIESTELFMDGIILLFRTWMIISSGRCNYVQEGF